MMKGLYGTIRNYIGCAMAVLAVCCIFGNVQGIQAHTNQKVLFINSYAYDFVSVPHIISGLKDAVGTDFEINYLFMNAKLLGSERAEQEFYQALQPFKNTHYDIIVLSDDDALNFMRKYRQEFFPGVPIVYTGINIRENAIAAHQEGMTGVIETISFGNTIRDARKIMPQATRVVGIIDNTPTGVGNRQQFMDTQQEIPDLTFSTINTSEYTQADLATQMESYGDDTILVLITFTNDKEGNHYSSEQGAEFLAGHTQVPFFAATELGFGSGALGGDMDSMYDIAYKAGILSKRILQNGENPADIEPETMEGTKFYDYAVMRRYHIKKSQLPDNAVFINEPEDFYSKYRNGVLTVAAVFLLLLIWLAREIRNNRRRKSMNAELLSTNAKMQAALQHSGLHLWEYFPEQKLVLIRTNFNKDVPVLERVEDYPQCWIDNGLVHPDDADLFLETIKKIDGGAKVAGCDIRTKYVDGGWHWERIRLLTVFDEEGVRTEVIGTAERLEAYKELEERFFISMEQSGIAAWVYDFATNSIRNEQQQKSPFDENMPLDGYPESIIAAGYIHADDVEIYRDLYRRIHAGEKRVDVILRWRKEADTYSWYHFFYTVIFDITGAPSKAFGTCTDVTTLKRNEEAFAMELKRSAAYEGQTLSSCYIDLRTEEIFEWKQNTPGDVQLDGSIRERLQATASRIPNRADREMFLKTLDPQNLRLKHDKDNIHRFSFEYRRQTLQGQLVWVRTYIYLSQHYGSQHLVAYLYTRDIDDIKVRQLALDSALQEEVEYLCVIDIVNGQEHVLKTRLGCEFKVGQTYSYVVQAGQVVAHAVADDREMLQTQFDLDHIIQRLQQGKPCIIYYREPNEIGKIRRKRTTVYYLDDRRNHLVYVRSDITQLYEEEQRQKHKLEKALNQAKTASRAKSDFLSRMSHEIRTPMNAIIGLATLTRGHTQDAEYVEENIEKINMSAHFLLELINDILDISRIESGRMELNAADVRFDYFLAAIDTIIRSRAEEKDIQYHTKTSGIFAPAYRFDELKLKQVLINILSNAVKFTPAGGQVELLIENCDNGADDDLLRFRIADTGIGIDAQFLPKVFDAFAQEYSSNTTLYGGTGLGLAISKSIVELMGGTIGVESTKNVGTTFTVEVRLQHVADEDLAALGGPNGIPLRKAYEFDFHGKRVLLVEDNEINREVARTILEECHMEVETAVNGREAVEAFEGHPNGYYDAILMDVRMPVMDGLAATRQIRASHRKDAVTIPILAMTANAFEEDVRKSLAAGMDAHLTKPIDPDVLCYRLSEYIK